MVKASKALRNHALGIASIAALFKNAKMVLYTGSAPTNPEDAATGTALVTITDTAQAHTAEVCATGTVSVTGTTGNVTALTVNGVNVMTGTVAYTTDAATTAALLAAAINKHQSFPKYVASAVGAVVTISGPRGSGATPNGYVVAKTGTLTCTTANMAGGVDSANGLKFDSPAAGVLSKRTGQEWSGVATGDGDVGYWRIYCAVADAGGSDATEVYPRLQGSLATTGGDINLTSLTMKNGAKQQINAFEVDIPVSAG